MLGRPQTVGTETKQKFHQLSIGVGAYVLDSLVDGILSPGQHGPVLVVDEESTVLHTGSFHLGTVSTQVKGALGGRLHISPPYIRRYAYATTQFKQAVSCAAWSAPKYHQSLANAFGRVLYQL